MIARIAIAAIVLLATLELGAWAILAARPAPTAAGPVADADATLEADGANVPAALRPYVLHPYVGYVRDPGLPQHVLNGAVVDVPVNEHGFFGPAPTPERRDEYVVALAGGSVATELFLRAGDALSRRIGELPAAQGKTVRLVSIALGGFKQPQQLAALTYFLGLGFHFDAVVNLDGFNEVVLPFAENRPQRAAPAYPRMWRVYASRSIEAGAAVLYGRIFEARAAIDRARARESGMGRYSGFVRLLARNQRARAAAEQRLLEEALRERLARRPLTYQERGPRYPYGDAMFADFAALWRNASLQMDALCRANGITYLHLLQPNQYVPGSKTFDETERARALADPGTAYREGVERGYPALLREAAQLGAAGVPFVDATGIFRDDAGPIYRDRCCHLNERGNQRLIDAIATALSARP